MDDTELYTKLLGITPPWRVTRVTVDMAAGEAQRNHCLEALALYESGNE